MQPLSDVDERSPGVAAFPPRSRLYGLRLAGEDGATQEGILDYVHRLSIEHCVRVRHLLSDVVLPEAGVKGAFYRPGHFSADSLRGCQGWSSYTQRLVAALARLTGSDELERGTLVGWKDLLDPRGYAARKRRWCSLCLQERREAGLHYFSLAWSFDAVTVCSKHACPLCSACSFCGSFQPFVGDWIAAGKCCSCGHWLRESTANSGAVVDCKSMFNARSLDAMISARNSLNQLLSPAYFVSRLQAIANGITAGSLHKLERQLRLSYDSLRSPCRHRLEFVLEVLYRLGSSPVDFFLDDRMMPEIGWGLSEFRMQARLSHAEVVEARAHLERRLESAKRVTDAVVTRREFVRDTKVNAAILGSSLIDLERALSKHNGAARIVAKELLWERRAALIELAMRSLLGTGLPLTSNSIARALVEVGLHRRNPRVRRMAMDTLMKLMIDKKA